jgi:hypothetical protein
MINSLLAFLRNWLWFLKLHPHASAHVDCACGETVSPSSSEGHRQSWLEKHRPKG